MGLAQVSLEVGRECFLRAGKQSFLVEVLGMAQDTVWLSFPDASAPRRGTGLELEVHDGRGFASYHAVMRVGPKETGHGILIERRSTSAYMKHRRNWRVPTDFPTWMQGPDDGDRHDARILDLSYDGAKVQTRGVYSVGTTVQFELKLPRRPSHRISATVIYAANVNRNRSRAYGLRFTTVSQNGRDSLRKFLSARIQELYPEELRALYPRSVVPAPQGVKKSGTRNVSPRKTRR